MSKKHFKINAKTAFAAVLGDPISHSLSPLIHNYWSEALGENLLYVPLKCSPQELGRMLHALHDLPCRGVNLTVPLKETALKIVDRLAGDAAAIGAVNTIVFTKNAIIGHNTDAIGFGEALRYQSTLRPRGKAALLLGAGGASRACAYEIARMGFSQLIITNRTEARAHELRSMVRKKFKAIDVKVCPFKRGALSGYLPAIELLVNSTSVVRTEKKSPTLPLDFQALAPHTVCVDLVYPKGRSVLYEGLRSHRCKNPFHDGLEMLIRQAQHSYALWTGRVPSLDGIRRQLRR